MDVINPVGCVIVIAIAVGGWGAYVRAKEALRPLEIFEQKRNSNVPKDLVQFRDFCAMCFLVWIFSSGVYQALKVALPGFHVRPRYLLVAVGVCGVLFLVRVLRFLDTLQVNRKEAVLLRSILQRTMTRKIIVRKEPLPDFGTNASSSGSVRERYLSQQAERLEKLLKTKNILVAFLRG